MQQKLFILFCESVCVYVCIRLSVDGRAAAIATDAVAPRLMQNLYDKVKI